MRRISKPASRFLSLLMAVVMIIGMLPVPAFAAEGDQGEPVTTVVEEESLENVIDDETVIDEEQENVDDVQPVIEEDESVVEDEELVIEEEESIVEDDETVIDLDSIEVQQEVVTADETVAITTTKEDSTATEEITVAVGEAVTVKLTSGSSQSKTFTVSYDSSVASVDPDSQFTLASGAAREFEITGLKAGKTTIRIAANDSTHRAIIVLTVTGDDNNQTPPAIRNKIDIKAATSGAAASGSVDVGSMLIINLENGSSSNKTYSVQNSNPSAASVEGSSIAISGSGKEAITVTGLANGKTTITFSAPSNGGGNYTATVTVTVGTGVSEGGSTNPPSGDTTSYAKVENVSTGKYVIVVGGEYALTNVTGTTASGTNSYAGLKSSEVTISSNKVTAGTDNTMIWTVTKNSNGKLTIQDASGKYLTADYGAASGGNTRKLLLGSTADANWEYSTKNNKTVLNNTAQNTSQSGNSNGCYLHLTSTDTHTVSVRSQGSNYTNAAEVEFYYVGAASGTTPEIPDVPDVPGIDGDSVVVITGSDYQGDSSDSNFRALLNKLKSVYGSVHGILFGGDYSNSMPTSNSDVQKAKTAITDTFADIEQIVLVKGNHDNGNNSSLLARTGEYDTDYYGVYAINESDFPSSYGGGGSSTTSTASALKTYLDQKITQRYTKPIFVVTHLPLHKNSRNDNNGAANIFTVLNDAGKAGLNIIFMFGHNHSNGSYDNYLGGGSIYLKKGDSMDVAGGSTNQKLNFTYMNCGYVGYCNNTQNTLTMAAFEISEDEVVVKRYSTSGTVNLKAAGNGSGANTTVYQSPQTITLNSTITPNPDPEPEDPETPTGNQYLIISEGHALTSNEGEKYTNSSTYDYYGFNGVEYTEGMTVTSDMLWTIEETTGGYYIMQGGQYLNGTYGSVNNRTEGRLKLDSTKDVWVWEGEHLKSTNASATASSAKYLTFGNGSDSNSTLFSVRSTSTATDIELIPYTGSVTPPDGPGEGGQTATGAITLDKTAANATLTKEINVGDKLVITLTNPSGGSKALSATVEGDKNVVGIDPESFDINRNNGTKVVTITGKKDGSVKITFSGNNTAADGGGGSTYYAVINLTVKAVETEHQHNIKPVEGKAATCTEAGWKDYYQCQDTECAEYFSDADGKNEITDLTAWKNGAGKIAAKDHAWGEATYTFAENGKSCTAKRVCGNDATHVENATATISSKVKTPATCTVEGTTTYTATFAETWAATQTKDVQDIAAKDHAWGAATYAFAENGSTCTAQRVCGNDATHVENATATITSKVKTPATCTVKGTTTYTATFTETWAATQTKDVQDIAVIPHPYDTTTWKKDDKNHWHECSVCGDKTDVAEHKSNAAATETAPEVCAACGYEMNPALSHTHDWSVTYTFAEDGSSCTAKRVCSKDTTHTETATATITSAVKTPATCEDKGTTTYTATFTESWAETQTLDVEDIAAKNHAWTVTYNFAEDGKSCTATHVCGNDAEHNETATATISSAVKTPATCEEMGTTTYTATFTEDWAATQTKDVKDIAATNHAWTVTYNFAADGKSCTATHVCGNDAAHNETANAAISSTVKIPATCKEKGTTTYTATFSVSWAATQTKDVQDIATVDHNFEDGECTVCGEPDPDFGEPAYKQIAASDIKVDDKIIIVGKSGSSYYALTNGSNQRTAVTVSGDAVTVSGSADALIWTVGEATGNQIDAANGNDLDYVFSNGSTYFGRVTDSNVVEFQTGSAANTKYFGHDIANSTIGNYSRGGAYYGLLYQDNRFIYVENANNSNASVLFFKAINVVDDDEPTQPEQPSGNPTKVTRLEDGKYVIVSSNNTKALTSAVHNGYTNTNNYSYKGFNGANVTIANNEITAGYTADMVFEITAKSGVTNGYTIKHVSSGKFLTATYTQNSNGGYDGLLTLTNTAEDTWVLDSNFRLKSTKASDNNRGSTLYLTFDDKTDTITSGSGSLFGVRSDSNSFANVDTIDFYKVNDSVTPEPGTKTLSSIAVTTNPTKMTYTAGEDFDPAGMVVTATYSDNTTAPVTGYTLSGDKDLAAGSRTITISYTEGGVNKTTTLTVTVNQASQPDEPTGNPTKVTTLEDGNYVIVANNMAMTNVVHNGYTNSNSYSYKGFTGASVTISGNEITAGATDNMIFEVKAEGNGYTIMQDGKYLSATYTQNSGNSGWTGVLTLSDTKDIWTWSNSNGYLKSTNASNGAGDKGMYLVFDNESNNVQSGNQNNLFGIRSDSNSGNNMDRVDFYRVGELKQVSSIKVVTAPSKTEYYAGQSFNSAGMVIEVTYEDGTKATISSGFTVDNGSNLTAGQSSVTISYRGKTTTQPITVTVRPEGEGTTYVAFSSDVHSKTTSTTSGSPARLNSWITTVTDIIDGTFDTMAFCGDNAAGDNSAYGDTYWSYVEPVMNVVTTNSGVNGDGIFLNGNHEWQHGEVGTSNNAVAKKIKPVHYVHEGDDYVIYVFGATSQDQNGTGFKTADITTLGNWLATAPADKPIFIASHFPIHSAGNRSTANAATLRSTLNQYADDLDLYFLWGHNHTNANSSETNYDKVITGTLENQPIGFTYMAAGCMSDSEYSGGSAAVKGKGLAAKIVDGQVESLTYYGENGNVVYTYEPDYDDDQVGETTATLSSIAVSTYPTKMSYVQGENFDSTGMVVTATYSDGSTKVVTDYTVTGGTNMAVGTNAITISYTEGGVTREATLNVTVNAPATLDSIAVTTEPTMMVYAVGESFNPAGMVVTATYTDGTTKVVTGYTVDGGDNMVLGTNHITISYREGGVTKVATLSVTVVNAQAVSSIAVTTNPDKMVYTVGENFDPTGMVVTATYGDGSTRPVSGYTTENDVNMPIGENTITISYKEGGVTKSTTLTVTVKAPLTGIEVNTESAKMEYAHGENFDPAGLVVTATYSDGTKEDVTGYTVEGGENMTVGQNTITVRYTERGVTKTKELVVTVYAVLDSIAVTTNPTKMEYAEGDDFDAAGMVVTATYSDGTAKAVTDYTIEGGEKLAVGENTITISYKEGEVTKTTTLVVTAKAVLTGIEVTTNPTKVEYTEGDDFDPAGMVVTATYSDGTTKAVTDYTIEGGEEMAAGEKTVTISYTDGEVTKTVTLTVTVKAAPVASVQRVAGTSRADTALEVADALKEALGVEKFDTIIIANGEDKNFADALTGSYLATVKKAPILMYRTSGLSDSTRAYIQNNLVSGGTIYLLGGELAIPADVETELSASYTVKRLSGGSRFDTNLAILKEAGVGNKEILIARGFEFADSLSASATGLPILIVNEVTGKLTDAQIEFLHNYENNKLTILGGTIAVSEELEATIEAVVSRDVDRVYGASREATSVEIAKRYFESPDFAVAAYSRRCPDGLCGGPLAYAMGAPLLLVNAGKEDVSNAYITENDIINGYVLGGTLVITDETARAVFGLAEDAVIEMK